MKKNVKKWVVGLFCIVIITICFEKLIMNKIENNGYYSFNSNIYNVDEDKLPFSEEEIYKQIFDIHNIVSISIDMTNTELKKLQSDFEKNKKSPIYRMANITISITIPNGKTYAYYLEEVGIRLKGNESRTSLYNENNGIINLDHFKINFSETFDDISDGYSKDEYYIDSDGNSTWDKIARKKRKKRTFGNMEKIAVKWNKNFDTTYLREYYAFELFRSEGIAAPRIGLTTMKINVPDKKENSAYLGVYSIQEFIDSKFIKNNLLNKDNNYMLNKNGDYTDGDLYKVKWDNEYGDWVGANLTTKCSYGIADNLHRISYNYELKTNKKKSDFSALSNLINGLNDVSSKNDLGKYVDMNYFIKFAAVSYVTGNGDDMRNNYNNYYLYFYTDNSDIANPIQKMIVIPYDYDRSFGITIDMNSDGTAMTNVDPFSTKATNNEEQENPLYKYSVCEGGYYIHEYSSALREVLNNKLLSIKTFKKYYNIAKNNYGNKVTPSKDFNNIVSSKTYEKVTRESFYFTIDTSNDIKKMNTKSTDEITKNLIIEDYFTKIRSTLKKTLDAKSH